MLIYPYKPTAESPIITLENFPISDSLKSLFEYLRSCGFMIDIEGYHKELLGIFSNNVIKQLQKGEEGWEEFVPPTVADFIKNNCLFDYPCEVK
jgi:hypothetical protein